MANFPLDRLKVLDLHKISKDPYHRILSLPIFYFFALSLVVYLAINLIFAGLYMLDPGGIANIDPNNFLEHFFFSVQSISTIGYGYMYPQTEYAHWVMTAQVYVGVVNLAIATGIVFARFATPTAKIVFSNKALITMHNGQKCLMIRLANERMNNLVDAKAHLTLMIPEITNEGVQMRRLYELKTLRKHTPFLELSWTVIHPIDEDSPLFGKSEQDLIDMHPTIIAAIFGLDGTFNSSIYSKNVYSIHEIEFGGQFKDIIEVDSSGKPIVNCSYIHQIVHDDYT